MLSDSFLNFLETNAGGVIGVAVSGGSDSMALLRLTHEACAVAGVQVRAVTVDHALRAASATEAQFVETVCADMNIKHDVLVWSDGPQGGNLQDEARQARYGLMATWAAQHKLIGVLVGHTADDQAETFLMRLARGAGVDGLAGMPSSMRRGGVSFYRPLLACKRADLRAYLDQMSQKWIDDPSNSDPKFERVKARQTLTALSELDIGVDTLTQVADQISAASATLHGLTLRNISELVELDRGDVTFDWRAFCRLSHDEARRFVLGVANGIAPAAYPPRRSEQKNLLNAVRQRQTVTLHGCLWSCKDERIRVAREYSAVRDIACATTELWDNRWTFEGPHAADLHVAALGEDGILNCPDWREMGLPRASLLASPAVWRGVEMVAAPVAGFGNGWCARLTRSREQFLSSLLSH